MPRKAVGMQPPNEGPIWEAFLKYWLKAPDRNGARAIAWRAFHAAWLEQDRRNSLGAGIQSLRGDLPVNRQ